MHTHQNLLHELQGISQSYLADSAKLMWEMMLHNWCGKCAYTLKTRTWAERRTFLGRCGAEKHTTQALTWNPVCCNAVLRVSLLRRCLDMCCRVFSAQSPTSPICYIIGQELVLWWRVVVRFFVSKVQALPHSSYHRQAQFTDSNYSIISDDTCIHHSFYLEEGRSILHACRTSVRHYELLEVCLYLRFCGEHLSAPPLRQFPDIAV